MTEQKWTLADIRQANQTAGNHFFDRSTLRFFGETMKSYRVRNGGKVDSRGLVWIERVGPSLASRQWFVFDPQTGDVRKAD